MKINLRLRKDFIYSMKPLGEKLRIMYVHNNVIVQGKHRYKNLKKGTYIRLVHLLRLSFKL